MIRPEGEKDRMKDFLSLLFKEILPSFTNYRKSLVDESYENARVLAHKPKIGTGK